jgi:hypothetical protein
MEHYPGICNKTAFVLTKDYKGIDIQFRDLRTIEGQLTEPDKAFSY